MPLPHDAKQKDANEMLRDALAKDLRPSHEIAALVGITPMSVRRFKCGGKNLSGETMKKMASALGYEIQIKLKKIS